jgi:hypothetical protein
MFIMPPGTEIVNQVSTHNGVPVATAAGCVGVLAVELPSPGERRAFVCASASILTAQLAGFFGAVPTEAVSA